MNDYDNLYGRFLVMTTTCHARIVKMLAALPIPISIDPAFDTPTAEVDAVIRARQVLTEMPLDETVRAMARTAILDFLTGVYASVEADEGGADASWLIEAAIVAMIRCDDAITEVLNALRVQ